MISTQTLNDRVEVRAFGQLTMQDWREIEEQAAYRERFSGPIDMLVDLRDMTGCSLDSLLEEWRFARRHAHQLRRVAVLADDELVTWNMWLAQWVSDAEIRVFDDEYSADGWLGAPAPLPTTLADDVLN